MPTNHPRDFEPWMLPIVEDVYRSTSPPMLTLRCPQTAHLIEDPRRRASCASVNAIGSEVRQNPLRKGAVADERKGVHIRRAIEVRYRTKRFPDGIPVGVCHAGKYVRNEQTGTEDFVVVSSNYDISMPQLEVLQSLAEGRKYPSDADRRRSRDLVAAAQVNERNERMDPVGTEERKAVTMAKAMVAAGLGAGAAPSVANIPDEEFEAEAVRRRMAKARAARGKKPAEETVDA